MTEADVTNLQKLLEVLLHNSMKNFIVYLKERDLSMSHIGALFVIHRHGSCGVSEIGDSLGITTAGTSQMLNRLVDDGLIERTEDTLDRRAKRIVLTRKGKEMLAESIHVRQNWIHDLVASLDEIELAEVNQALQILLSRARQVHPLTTPPQTHTE